MYTLPSSNYFVSNYMYMFAGICYLISYYLRHLNVVLILYELYVKSWQESY